MPTERDLIDRTAAGEHDAFARLIAPYRAELLRFAARQLGVNRELAEDVVQQALLNAYRALSAGVCPENVRAWLFTIVRNSASNARRSGSTSLPLDALDRADPGLTPPELVEQAEWIDWLMGAIAELPARQREVLVGHAFEGRSHVELAGRQQTTVLAVKTLLHRARRRLAEQRGASPLSAVFFLRGRLAGAKAGLGLAGQALAAAAVTTAVLLAVHAPGVGSVLAAGATPRTVAARALAAARHTSPATSRHDLLTPERVHREARRAVVACTHGLPGLRRFSRSALSYAAHHLSADQLEYTECESLLSRASLPRFTPHSDRGREHRRVRR